MPKSSNNLSLIEQLNAALPQGRAVCFSASEHEGYTKDYSSADPVEPTIIITPKTQDDIVTTLNILNQTKTPLTVRGTGTGKTGGAIPTPGGVVLAMHEWNRILEIDTDNRVAVVEPGVITKDLQTAVEEKDLLYPPDPASLDICSIGGNVAENAGGPRALKYGVTGDYVLGLEGVWANGTPFKLGGKLYKNVAGYDLMRLLIGSEGTLGIITKIYLKLLPQPKAQTPLWIAYPTITEALNALKSAPNPSIAELMDRTCIKAVEKALGEPIPYSDAGAHVILEVDEPFDTNGSIIKNTKDVWKIRRSISEALTAYSKTKESHDITVPPSNLAPFFEFLESLCTSEVTVLGYGHLGDGNVHVNILNIDCPNWETTKQHIEETILKKVVELDGSISGEHGIGLTKKAYLNLMFDDETLKFMHQIKLIFDPNNILNPNKAI